MALEANKPIGTSPTCTPNQILSAADALPGAISQGDAVADAAAATALNPAAPTAYSAHASGGTTVTSNAATDLDTTAAALATLRGEVATYELAISALIVDVADIRTQLNALITSLEGADLIAS